MDAASVQAGYAILARLPVQFPGCAVGRFGFTPRRWRCAGTHINDRLDTIKLATANMHRAARQGEFAAHAHLVGIDGKLRDAAGDERLCQFGVELDAAADNSQQ